MSSGIGFNLDQSKILSGNGFIIILQGNPSAKQYGISFAVLCPAFTETSMLINARDQSKPPSLLTYEENKEKIEGVIQLLGINRYPEL